MTPSPQRLHSQIAGFMICLASEFVPLAKGRTGRRTVAALWYLILIPAVASETSTFNHVTFSVHSPGHHGWPFSLLVRLTSPPTRVHPPSFLTLDLFSPHDPVPPLFVPYFSPADIISAPPRKARYSTSRASHASYTAPRLLPSIVTTLSMSSLGFSRAAP